MHFSDIITWRLAPAVCMCVPMCVLWTDLAASSYCVSQHAEVEEKADSIYITAIVVHIFFVHNYIRTQKSHAGTSVYNTQHNNYYCAYHLAPHVPVIYKLSVDVKHREMCVTIEQPCPSEMQQSDRAFASNIHEVVPRCPSLPPPTWIMQTVTCTIVSVRST